MLYADRSGRFRNAYCYGWRRRLSSLRYACFRFLENVFLTHSCAFIAFRVLRIGVVRTTTSTIIRMQCCLHFCHWSIYYASLHLNSFKFQWNGIFADSWHRASAYIALADSTCDHLNATMDARRCYHFIFKATCIVSGHKGILTFAHCEHLRAFECRCGEVPANGTCFKRSLARRKANNANGLITVLPPAQQSFLYQLGNRNIPAVCLAPGVAAIEACTFAY